MAIMLISPSIVNSAPELWLTCHETGPLMPSRTSPVSGKYICAFAMLLPKYQLAANPA